MIPHTIGILRSLFVGLGFLIVLAWLSFVDFGLFHFFIELGTVVAGMSIFLLAWNTRELAKNDLFTYLGIAFFYSSFTQVFHILTHATGASSDAVNQALQFWLIDRALWASFLAAVPFLAGSYGRINARLLFVVLGVIVLGAMVGVIRGAFPPAFIAGEFTIGAMRGQIALILFLCVCLYGMVRVRKRLAPILFEALALSLGTSIAGGLLVLFGGGGVVNQGVSILLTGISEAVLFYAMVVKSVKEPFAFVFEQLNQANIRLQMISRRDDLTGLPNRRHILSEVEKQFYIAKRFDRPFAIVMIDVDNFKGINDTYGHIVGDEVLRELARVLRGSIRAVDLVGRYGGDEFLICPLETSLHEARIICKDVSDKVKKQKFTGNGAAFFLTISCGIGILTDSRDVWEVIRAADYDLLNSKKAFKAGAGDSNHIG